jgi:hypothetical protein
MNSGALAGTKPPRGGTSSSTQSVRCASATSARVPIIVTTPDSRAATTRGASGSTGSGRPASGVPAVDELPRVVTDEFDQRRYAQRLADVVHVHHQCGDACEHEKIRRRDGDARNLPCAVAPVQNLADRQHGVHEGRDEEPDCELAGLVAKNPLHDPG